MAETKSWLGKAHEFALAADSYRDRRQEETDPNRRVLLSMSFTESVRKVGYCLEAAGISYEDRKAQFEPSEEQAVSAAEITDQQAVQVGAVATAAA